jgi:hypothetical protein
MSDTQSNNTNVGGSSASNVTRERGSGDDQSRSNNGPAAAHGGGVLFSASAPAFEILARLHVTSCDGCGIAFALPASLYLERLKARGVITCPNGHANALTPLLMRTADLTTLHVAALKELTHLGHRLRVALAELETLRPKPGDIQPPGKAELKRRAYILDARAERAEYGKGVCRFCGKSSSALRKHILAAHLEELKLLPASSFEIP